MKKAELSNFQETMLKYSLVAGAFLAGAQNANAQVWGFDVNPDVVLGTHGETLAISFNGNNLFQLRYRRTSTYRGASITANTSGGSWIKKTDNRPKALTTNYVVSNGAASGFVHWVKRSFAVKSQAGGFAVGTSFFNTDKYIGVKFKIGANTHYGWIRVYVTVSGNDLQSVTVKDYAYEQTADASITANAALPVELINFYSVQIENTVKLIWETATEVNNYGFEIERRNSDDNTEWTKIGFVPGNGNSNTSNSYDFLDESPINGRSQYRLKQTDFDGNYEYYPTIVENNGIPTSGDIQTLPIQFELSQNYPNPFNPSTKIKFSLPESSEVTIKVFNTLGQEVAEILSGYIEAGRHEINFDAGALPSGFYIYRLVSSNGYASEKKMLLVK